MDQAVSGFRVAGVLEERVEPIFHSGSYGYRPRRSALDAVATCRRRCWQTDWVIDLDIAKFFDSVPWDLVVKAVEANTELPWVVLQVTALTVFSRNGPGGPTNINLVRKTVTVDHGRPPGILTYYQVRGSFWSGWVPGGLFRTLMLQLIVTGQRYRRPITTPPLNKPPE